MLRFRCPHDFSFDIIWQNAVRYNASRARGALLKVLVGQQLPFRIVETDDFQAYQKELNPKAEGITGKTVRDNLIQSWEAGKEHIKAILKVRVSDNFRKVSLTSLTLFLSITSQSIPSRLTCGLPSTRNLSSA